MTIIQRLFVQQNLFCCRALWVAILCCSSTCVTAQERRSGVVDQTLMPGPDGVWILVSDSKINHSTNVQYVVSRDDQRGRGFRKLSTVTFPSSADELEKRLGSSLTNEILTERGLTTVADLFNEVTSGRLGVFGNRLYTPVVLQALGWLYVDRDVGKRDNIRYRVDRIVNGAQQVLFEKSLHDVQYEPFPEFRSQHKVISDSVVMLTWYAVGGRAAFAEVYDALSGSAVVGRVWVYNRSDTIFATYIKKTRPGEQMALFIRPVDLPGNAGASSDTVSVIAASFRDRLMVSNLVASDSLGGVVLKWDPLPAKAWFTGIRILKSRSATDNFIAMDTLPAQVTQWTDRNILTGVQYYYIVEPLVFDLPQGTTTTPAQANIHVKGGRRGVMAPQGVTLTVTPERNVKITWLPNSELDVFAYYVLRGTSKENMTVISEGVRDTVFVDSLSQRIGGISYQYGVVAMDMELNSSDTSDIVSVMLPQARYVPSVGGLSARFTDQGVRLFWPDDARSDASVVGYVLYVRQRGDQYFQPVMDSVIRSSVFLDRTKRKPGVYEYGCAAIDAWNNQSILSTVAEVQIEGATRLYPPPDFDLRNTSQGVEVRIPEEAGDSNSETRRYVIYRCLADGAYKWQRVGETSSDTNLFLDRQAVRNQLYIYAISTRQDELESLRSIEKSIRRK